MTVENASEVLKAAGFAVEEIVGLPDGHGTKQLRLATGQVVNVYATGKYVVQGASPERVRRVLERPAPLNRSSRPEVAPVPPPPPVAEVDAHPEPAPSAPRSNKSSGLRPRSPDGAYYKPLLKGRHVVVVTPKDVKRIAQIFEEFSGCAAECFVALADGYVRTLSVEALCEHENSPRQPIRELGVEVDAGDDLPAADLTISSSGTDNVEIRLRGEHEKVDALRRALEDRLHAMTPSYAWLAKRDMGMWMVGAAIGGWLALMEDRPGLGIVLMVFAALCSPWVWRRCFPRTSFRIGQGEHRFQTVHVVRNVVLLGLAVNLVAAVIVALGSV